MATRQRKVKPEASSHQPEAPPLHHISDADLRAELRRREDEERLRREIGERLRRAGWLSNIDAAIALVPEHDRTTCDDGNLSNTRRCRRCALLDAKLCDWWPEDMTMELVMTLPQSD